MQVRIDGLRDLQSELRRVDGAWPRQLRAVNLDVAESVARKARAAGGSLGGVAAKAAPSIKALAQQRNASVKIGGARYPYALGAEFGAKRWPQFQAWTGNRWTDPEGNNTGYFLHPTIRSMVRSGDVLEQYERMLTELTRQAFPH